MRTGIDEEDCASKADDSWLVTGMLIVSRGACAPWLPGHKQQTVSLQCIKRLLRSQASLMMSCFGRSIDIGYWPMSANTHCRHAAYTGVGR